MQKDRHDLERQTEDLCARLERLAQEERAMVDAITAQLRATNRALADAVRRLEATGATGPILAPRDLTSEEPSR